MSERPNILLIMTDQQRGDCLSIEGHPVLQTPNMDHIGAQGARFKRAYTTCPSCIATRRSLMTGQHPQTHGMVGYADGLEWDHPTTLPEALRESGYHTHIVGRPMHLSPKRKRYGFDEMVVSGGDYENWLRDRTGEDTGGWWGGGVMHNDWTARHWHLPDWAHHSSWTTTEALKFLERRDPSQPFFLCVSYLSPHPPLQPPAFYYDRYMREPLVEPVIGDWAETLAHDGMGDDVARRAVMLQGERLKAARAGYYGLINHIDDQLRRLLNPVNGVKRMTDNNTIVLFTSDHGELLGDHHLWGKCWPYEGSARVPLLFDAPPQLEVASRQEHDLPVCIEDIMPTLLDMADVPIPDSVDGRSLLPVMQGQTPGEWRDALHIEHAGHAQCVTDGKDKYIWRPSDGRELFFNLDSDPNEMTNRADDAAIGDQVDTWRQKLVDRLADRPEGFVQEGQLVAGQPYGAKLPHVHGSGRA